MIFEKALFRLRSIPRSSYTPVYIPQYPCRKYSDSPRTKYLLDLLQRNQELNEEDARDELRWLRDELRDSTIKTHAKETGIEMRLEELVKRRSEGEPIQYILGTTDFGLLTLKCRSPTLIPRPETAYCFEEFIKRIQQILSQNISDGFSRFSKNRSSSISIEGLKIVDLCTGSAPIPLLFTHLLPNVYQSILGVDISSKALELAQENIDIYSQSLDDHHIGGSESGKDEISGNSDKSRYGIRLMKNDLFAQDISEVICTSMGGKVDIITANPPYIPRIVWENLSPSVKKYEDPLALIGDLILPADPIRLSNGHFQTKRMVEDESNGDGLRFYRRIAEILPALLESEVEMERKGWKGIPRVALEIGEGQGGDVVQLLESGGSGGTRIVRTEIWNDQFGQERLVVGWTG